MSRVLTLGPVLVVLAGSAIEAQPAIRWEPHQLHRQTEGLTAQLGRLRVPLVRAANTGDSVELAFVRLQRHRQERHRQAPSAPIVYLTGGPGMEAIPVASVEFFARLAELGDVILLDQRGVGQSSHRAQCASGSPLTYAERLTGRARIARAVSDVRGCVQTWTAKGLDIRAFTNRESAADVEDLRKALGVPRLSLFAFSYGTHLALATLRDFPASIERAVLIGTAGPNDLRKLPGTADAQLTKLARLTASDSSVGGDVPDLAALLRRVLATLDSNPMKVRVTERASQSPVDVAVSADLLKGILIGGLGEPRAFVYYPALLATIAAGDPSVLAWYTQQRYNSPIGTTDLMALGMRCSAGATEERERERQTQAAASLLGNWINFPYPEVCSAVSHLDLGDVYRGPLITDVPILFVSGTLDMNTPPQQAELLRARMTRATHLLVENAGHNDLLPNAAVSDAVVDYFAGQDVSGRQIVLPVPAFKSIAAAKRERQIPVQQP